MVKEQVAVLDAGGRLIRLSHGRRGSAAITDEDLVFHNSSQLGRMDAILPPLVHLPSRIVLVDFWCPFQRACAATRALADRCFFVMLAADAKPPMRANSLIVIGFLIACM